jgi:hypothetical protein
VYYSWSRAPSTLAHKLCSTVCYVLYILCATLQQVVAAAAAEAFSDLCLKRHSTVMLTQQANSAVCSGSNRNMSIARQHIPVHSLYIAAVNSTVVALIVADAQWVCYRMEWTSCSSKLAIVALAIIVLRELCSSWRVPKPCSTALMPSALFVTSRHWRRDTTACTLCYVLEITE